MIVSSPGTQQPPLLARPSHGLLARHGWLWLGVPGATLVLAGFVASGVEASAGVTRGATVVLTGFALFVGAACLVIGVPLRAIVTHRHRRLLAADSPLPTLNGRYPAVPALDAGRSTATAGYMGTGVPGARRRTAVHLVVGSLLIVLIVCIYGLLAVVGIGSLVDGIHAVRLQHSSSAQHVTAILDRDTSVQHDRDTTYTDHVSYVVAGNSEHDVSISADGAEVAGQTITVIVDPHDPGDPIAATNQGYGDLYGGGVAMVLLLLFGGLFVTARIRDRRTAAPHRVPPTSG